jgi:hypothetical protein
MQIKECVTCGVKWPKPALTKKGECVFCDPPYTIDS